MSLKAIPTQGRTTSGVYLMRMNDGDIVASTTIVEETKVVEVDRVTEETQDKVKNQTTIK